jgi:hypothetical protein
MSSTILKRKLLTLLSDHGCLLKQLLRHQRILRGSFHEVYTRCGKSNCWCAKARRGHAHARLTWSQEGTMITRKVAAAERKPVVKLTNNYRQFCEHRRQLSALEVKIQDRLDQYEKALIHETRKPLAFLAIPSRMPAKNKPALQTRRPRRKQPM